MWEDTFKVLHENVQLLLLCASALNLSRAPPTLRM